MSKYILVQIDQFLNIISDLYTIITNGQIVSSSSTDFHQDMEEGRG